MALAFYQKYQDFDFPELLLYFESKFEELYEKVEHLSETDLYETIRYRTKAGNAYTAGRLIALNTTAPYRNARIRLRKWKKEYQKSDF